VGARKNLFNELHFLSSIPKLFVVEVGVVIEMPYVIDTCVCSSTYVVLNSKTFLLHIKVLRQ
jgi:hypothetical protein